VNDEIITSSFKQTQELGEKFAQTLQGGAIIALHGDLGSGKTTFTQGVAKGLGLSQPIVSPTFILMREYRIDKQGLETLYHIDLYRTESERDAKGLGIEDVFADKEGVVLVEWPEKMGNLLPEKRIDIFFEYLSETERKVLIKET
jgi:tRNA threonylcarbamoyladenosine biosynthesis protein TsaE